MDSDMTLADHIKMENPVRLVTRSKVKKYAYDNAWTLILMAVLFAITWVAMIVYGVWNSV